MTASHVVADLYPDWPQYAARLRDGVVDLTTEQLALRAGPDHATIWQLAAHLAGSRTYWVCGVFKQPGAETTPFPEPLQVLGWEDDPDHPSRLSLDLLQSRDSVYLQVPSVSSHQGYEFMRDFIETVGDAQLRAALEDAIAERKPFRRFRNVIERHPDALKRWHDYKSARVLALVVAWLRSQGIEPVDTPFQS